MPPKNNIKTLAWLCGMSVADLARKIKRSRVQVYRAFRHPHQHGPTWRLIQEVIGAKK